jgi:hypothetical protein
MPVNNPGYDIESIDPQTGEVSYIEVKGTDGPWNKTGVAITHTQYLKAQKLGDSYWLYIVEEALSDNPQIFKIKNPIAQINSYFFDENWKNIAGNDSEQSQVADEPSLDELVNQLKACTESVFVDIIDYCEKDDLPLPVVGYELMNEAGEVVEGELELAWEEQMVGIYAEDGFDGEAIEAEGWTLFGPEVAQNLDELAKVLC